MFKRVSLQDFKQAFVDYGRENQFSDEALELIYNDQIAYEEGAGKEVELDVIAICCDYNEDTVSNVADQCDFALDEMDEDDDEEDFVVGKLRDETSVAGVTSDGNIVYRVY